MKEKLENYTCSSLLCLVKWSNLAVVSIDTNHTNVSIRVRTLTGKEIALDIEPDYKVITISSKLFHRNRSLLQLFLFFLVAFFSHLKNGFLFSFIDV